MSIPVYVGLHRVEALVVWGVHVPGDFVLLWVGRRFNDGRRTFLWACSSYLVYVLFFFFIVLFSIRTAVLGQFL